jgi:hypothetical protein
VVLDLVVQPTCQKKISKKKQQKAHAKRKKEKDSTKHLENFWAQRGFFCVLNEFKHSCLRARANA